MRELSPGQARQYPHAVWSQPPNLVSYPLTPHFFLAACKVQIAYHSEADLDMLIGPVVLD